MDWIKKIFGDNHKEHFIGSLEQVYNNLKEKNHDKDEHWFLANTWMAKYGDSEAAKQKGEKLMKYIAYTTTFQYSLLDAPKSIRGLVLYLAYKERGDKEDESEIIESTQIMTLVQQSLQNWGNLLDEYKQKNPFTWNEIQAEKDNSVYGLYGYLESVARLNASPEEHERMWKQAQDGGFLVQ